MVMLFQIFQNEKLLKDYAKIADWSKCDQLHFIDQKKSIFMTNIMLKIEKHNPIWNSIIVCVLGFR